LQFIVLDRQAEFWDLLEETNGLIFGGVVCAIMMAGNQDFFAALLPQMDMVVTSDAASVRICRCHDTP